MTAEHITKWINIWFVFGIHLLTPMVVSWKFYKHVGLRKKSIIWEQIWVGRQNIQEILFEAHGLRLDQVSGANDKDGTSNDGNQAPRSFLRKQLKVFPAGIYLLKVNNRNTRTRCKTCSKLTIKTPERYFVLVSLLLNLNIFYTLF